MEFPDHLKSDEKFLSGMFRVMLSAAPLSADISKWIVTGNAALVGVIFANLESLRKVIGATPLIWGLGLLLAALLLGASSFMLSMSIIGLTKSIEGVSGLLKTLGPPTGEMMEKGEFMRQLLSPFSGPLKLLVVPKTKTGETDKLGAEKMGIRLVCHIFWCWMFQIAVGVAGLLILVLSIK